MTAPLRKSASCSPPGKRASSPPLRKSASCPPLGKSASSPPWERGHLALEQASTLLVRGLEALGPRFRGLEAFLPRVNHG